jgi:hypothetical protein
VILKFVAHVDILRNDIIANGAFHMQRVSEAFRSHIPEFCLALTVFHEELSARVVLLFSLLLASSLLSSAGEERVTELETQGWHALSFFSRARLFGFLGTLLVCNTCAAYIYVSLLIIGGPSPLLLFSSLHSSLVLSTLRNLYRFSVSALSHAFRWQWHDTSLRLLIGKTCMDAANVAILCIYAGLLWQWYGMPLLAVRDLYKAGTDLHKELQNVREALRLRNTIHLMPCPTEQDLESRDSTCSVCMMEVASDERMAAKLLHCGHMLHTSCLLQWTQRQRICPMCRADINAMVQRAQEGNVRAPPRNIQVPLTPAAPAGVVAAPPPSRDAAPTDAPNIGLRPEAARAGVVEEHGRSVQRWPSESTGKRSYRTSRNRRRRDAEQDGETDLREDEWEEEEEAGEDVSSEDEIPQRQRRRRQPRSAPSTSPMVDQLGAIPQGFLPPPPGLYPGHMLPYVQAGFYPPFMQQHPMMQQFAAQGNGMAASVQVLQNYLQSLKELEAALATEERREARAGEELETTPQPGMLQGQTSAVDNPSETEHDSA